MKVRDETVNLAHHAVTCHLLVFLALLEEASKAGHNVTTRCQLARLVQADINRQILDSRASTSSPASSSTLPDLLISVLDERSLQLVADQAGRTGQAFILINGCPLLLAIWLLSSIVTVMIGVFTVVLVRIWLFFTLVLKIVRHRVARRGLLGRNEGIGVGLPEV